MALVHRLVSYLVLFFLVVGLTTFSPHVQAQSIRISGAVSGAIKTSPVLDIASLAALGESDITTVTPWDDGLTTYTGVRLSRLLQHLGAFGSSLQFTALNDYRAVIPLSDVSEYDPLIAYKRNGELLSVLDKGPFFLMYPFSDRPELWNEVYFGRCVWQISDMDVLR